MKSSTKRPRRQPTNVERARFHVLHDLGYSAQAIGQETGKDPKTVRKWLRLGVTECDGELRALIEQIRATELDDLYLLGAKARRRLHELAETETKMIPLIALQDRCFQQRRLLEGRSSANFMLLTKLTVQADATLFAGEPQPPAPQSAEAPAPVSITTAPEPCS